MSSRPWFSLLLLVVAVIGCGAPAQPQPVIPPATPQPAVVGTDPEQVRAADVSILFIGNSHTSSHNLPDLVARMIRFQQPGKTVYVRTLGVGHLEDMARNPSFAEELEAAQWKFVVLQAQKISVSGKFEYSRKEGIDFAKRAKARGATPLFYSEWGLKDVPGDGRRNEKIYREMATDSGAGVLPVGRAWDLALFVRPELSLHQGDGNHQSAFGAFLTGCVICGRLTGESPASLAAFPHPEGTEAERKLLAEAAAQALYQFRADGGP